MARSQAHEGKAAAVLAWSELLDEYGQAQRDWGSDLGTTDDLHRADELRQEIDNRVNRACLLDGNLRRFSRILAGEPL